MQNSIVIRGAKEHNLKNIDVTLPKNKLIVFTGLSGSGKSSLAFDTIYAEGQRRFVESLSSYARQFLGVMKKPDCQSIEGLSPSISIDQKTVSPNPRSTVGTVTEIYDYLRLLFARIGHPKCPNCGREIAQQGLDQIVQKTIELGEKQLQEKTKKQIRLMILSPVIRGKKGEFSQLFASLKEKGYQRVRVDGLIFDLDEDFVLIKTNKHNIDVVIDRLIIDSKVFKEAKSSGFASRLQDSIEGALKLSDGQVLVSEVKDPSFIFPQKPKKFADHLFSQKFACSFCNLSLPEIEPRTFSFNSPFGACPSCNGLGTLLKIDENLIINPNLSVLEGGILPFARLLSADTWFSRILKAMASQNNINLKIPIKKLKSEQLEKILYGTGEEIYKVTGENRFGKMVTIWEVWEGIIPNLERRYEETQSDYIREEIEKFMRKETCRKCQGARLKKEALSITVSEKSITQVSSLDINSLYLWLKNLSSNLSEKEKTIAATILKELLTRTNFLLSVGLDYITIDRPANSLAGGETQRIRLASQIGSGLSGVIYVLDEPSIGLHGRDNQRLIKTLKELRDLGNTIIVVEHDREIMENADLIIDFGPRAGEEGGEIVACATPGNLKKNSQSLTGKYLANKKQIKILAKKREGPVNGVLTISGCREHNLADLTASLPLGRFICVTGVSGSGKSSLVVDTLYPALRSKIYRGFLKEKPGVFEKIAGEGEIDKVILIDQSPIGKTPRSNPATYTGAFSFIRALFAQTHQAKMKGYKPGRFSFNVPGGRCEECRGEGQIKIEMQFLPPVWVDCEVCKGARYNQETLNVVFKGKNIYEVLQMTVAQALNFFSFYAPLRRKLEVLSKVGLDYIKLGQPAPTLSGGEAQRVKLAAELSKVATGKTFYILDEPTVGLHFEDLKKLIFVLRSLVGKGNTVVVIEHNLDLIKNADYILDLGPEGGKDGGRIIATGTPLEIAKNENSYTGRLLRKMIR